MEYADYALICKALSDSTRLQIIDMLKSGEKCACKLLEAFSITQPTLSYHMKTLIAAELVVSKKQGKWNYYSLNKEVFRSLIAFIGQNIEH